MRRMAFSALPSDQAKTIEPAFAQAGHGVCSNASSYRMDDDVPLLIPEVNPDHTALIKVQQAKRGWSGFIATNPNCTSTGFTIAFRPLLDTFGIKKAFVVSMQALSGAGYPGVASLDAVDNVVPYIGGEESKVETEPLQDAGQVERFARDRCAAQNFGAHQSRGGDRWSHRLRVVGVRSADRAAGGRAGVDRLRVGRDRAIAAVSPARVIEVRSEPDRPQPRRDRDTGNGMTTVVGRVREDPLFHVKFVVLSHNTIRGAAGGSLLNAELLVAQGLVK